MTEEKTEEATKGNAGAGDGGTHEEMSVTPGIRVPKDSNIIGGGTPGESTDMATASGPSDSGGG